MLKLKATNIRDEEFHQKEEEQRYSERWNLKDAKNSKALEEKKKCKLLL